MADNPPEVLRSCKQIEVPPPDRRGIDNRDCDVREAEEVRDREFREGAVRIVEETNKPIAQVARDLGVNEGTLGNWVNRAREAAEGTRGLSKDDVEELKRLRAEVAELRMERDVLKRSVVLWVKEATK